MTLSCCAHRYAVEAAGLHRFHSSLLITQGWFHCCAYCSVLSHQCQVNNFARKRKRKQSRKDIFFFFPSDLVSRGTLLLRTQLSCSWTDSGVVGPSPVPGAGAWMGLRPPLRVFLFRLLADWWDKVWWLCGGGSGGRSVDWLWWLAAPADRQREWDNILDRLWDMDFFFFFS